MSEAELELKEAQGGPAAAPPSPDLAETETAPEDMQEDAEDREETPMTAAEDRAARESAAAEVQEKNGAVKLKIPEDEEVHFTGLNKEELLRVAGTPGWVRTRWTLLVLFWLAWLGMLAGAVVIILQAPSCKELPALNWWNEGPLYRVRSIQDFSEARNIKGVEQKLDSLVELKVKGLVLGPVHVAPKDDPMALAFEEVSADVGSLEQFRSLLQTAHKTGLYVILDLTPNYQGLTGPWFSNVSMSNIADRLKSALVFWLTVGVDGVQLDAVDTVSSLVSSQWSDIKAIVQNWNDTRPHKRLLMGGTHVSSPPEVSVLLGDSGVDLLLSPVLSSQSDSTERAQSVQLLYSAHSQINLLWSLGPSLSPTPAPGLSTRGSADDCAQGKLDLLLLLTLPGTALIQSGDEVGLRVTQSEVFPLRLWDQNNTQQDVRSEAASCRLFLSSLSTLRSKERSLLFGDFTLLFNSSSVLVYVRSWDQSPRFLIFINSSPDQVFSWSESKVLGSPEGLGGNRGRVVLSSNSTALSPDSDLDLSQVQLAPKQAAIIQLLSS